MRHGLSASHPRDDALAAKTERLAALLAGEGAGRDRLALARLAAEAQLTVLRARAARVSLLEEALAACSSNGREGAACDCAPPITAPAYLRVLPELIKFSRYEGEALSQRRRGLWIMNRETALSSGGSSTVKHPGIAESRNEPMGN